MLNGSIEGIGDVKIILQTYHGSSLTSIDSVFSKNGKFKFVLPDNLEKGMLKVKIGANSPMSIDIVYNYENIEFATTSDSLLTAIEFLQSEENRLFYSFYPLILSIKQMLAMGDFLNANNPIESKQELIKLNHYIDELELQTYSLFEKISKTDEKLFAYKIIKMLMLPNSNFSLDKESNTSIDEYEFLKVHFFDNIDFTEEGLINTPFLSKYLSDYLINYVYPQNYEEYKKAVDMILHKFSANDKMFTYVSQILTNTFETSEFLDVYMYIFDTYLQENICNDMLTDEFKTYEIVKKSSLGSVAPEIKGQYLNGDVFKLSDMWDKQVLLMFWSPDCIHCIDMIKFLKYALQINKNTKTKIVAFAIVETKEEWERGIAENDMSEWIHVSDLKAYKSIVFNQIHIRGTPEIYVFRDGKIVLRPQDSETFLELLKQE